MEDIYSFGQFIPKKVYKVSELSSEIRFIIEEEIGAFAIFVEGEVSNFRGNYASGHWYFSLKDENSQISAVCFKSSNQRIKFTPENGMKVICSANVTVYEKQGNYQLNVRNIEPKGVGAQALALEKLKEKLKNEGLFDIARKRPLPYLAQKIGVVTSPTGAALRDILKVIYRRFQNVEVLISPTRVQGEEAPQEIINALKRLYKIDGIDLIIIARGGGSKEDLWVFNDENLARTIVKSPFPVISAVGHEIDVTIADLVADVRASTPSVAAELSVKQKEEIVLEFKNLKKRMVDSLAKKLNVVAIQLDNHVSNMRYIVNSKLDSIDYEIKSLAGKLDSLSPLKVMKRGYSIVYKIENNEVVSDSSYLKSGDKLKLQFHKSKTYCTVDDIDS